MSWIMWIFIFVLVCCSVLCSLEICVLSVLDWILLLNLYIVVFRVLWVIVWFCCIVNVCSISIC